MNLKSVTIFIATGGFLGKIPFAPGTFGTLAGIPIVFAMTFIPDAYDILFVTALVLFAIWTADRAEGILGKSDPGCIVIDEVAGYVVAMADIIFSIYTAAAGFLIFRLFDIVKPPPARTFEKKFKGGAGVVLDDIVAGLFTNIVLRIVF